MGLEFKSIATGQIVASFNEAEVKYLNLKVFEPFNERFNDLIDLYGTFRLYNNHLLHLQKLLLSQTDKVSESLFKVVTDAISNVDVLLGIGD